MRKTAFLPDLCCNLRTVLYQDTNCSVRCILHTSTAFFSLLRACNLWCTTFFQHYSPQIHCLSLHQGCLNGLSDSIISCRLRCEQSVFGFGYRASCFVRESQMLGLSSVLHQRANLFPDRSQFVK